MLGLMISSRGCQHPTTLNTMGEFQTNKRGVRPPSVATQGESYPTYAAVQFDPLPIWVGYNSRVIVGGVVKLFLNVARPCPALQRDRKGDARVFGTEYQSQICGQNP